jgi:hypothetical protein
MESLLERDIMIVNDLRVFFGGFFRICGILGEFWRTLKSDVAKRKKRGLKTAPPRFFWWGASSSGNYELQMYGMFSA